MNESNAGENLFIKKIIKNLENRLQIACADF